MPQDTLSLRIPTLVAESMTPTVQVEFTEIQRELCALCPGALPFVELRYYQDGNSYDYYYTLQPDSRVALVENQTLIGVDDDSSTPERRLLGYTSHLIMNDPITMMLEIERLWDRRSEFGNIVALVLPGKTPFLRPGPITTQVRKTDQITCEILQDNMFFQVQPDQSAHARLEALRELGAIATAYLRLLMTPRKSVKKSDAEVPVFQFSFGEVRHVG